MFLSLMTIQMSRFDVHLLAFEQCDYAVNRFVSVDLLHSLSLESLLKCLALRAVALAVIFCWLGVSSDDAFEVTQHHSAW